MKTLIYCFLCVFLFGCASSARTNPTDTITAQVPGSAENNQPEVVDEGETTGELEAVAEVNPVVVGSSRSIYPQWSQCWGNYHVKNRSVGPGYVWDPYEDDLAASPAEWKLYHARFESRFLALVANSGNTSEFHSAVIPNFEAVSQCVGRKIDHDGQPLTNSCFVAYWELKNAGKPWPPADYGGHLKDKWLPHVTNSVFAKWLGLSCVAPHPNPVLTFIPKP